MKKNILILIGILFVSVACGVKGDPMPPKTPPTLGRGQPTYKGATQDLKFPSVPPIYAPKARVEEEEVDGKEKK